jgi:signal transduction histidine kinase
VQDPSPEQYKPPLRPAGQAWRLLVSIAISALVWSTIAPLQWRQSRPLFWLDLGLGLISLVLSLFRRRWPLPVALLTAGFGALSASRAGPGTLTGVSLATRRNYWQIVLVGVVGVAASQVFPLLEPQTPNSSWWIDLTISVAFTVVMLVSGMYIGSRRELLWTLRDRADRAESEQELRVGQARSNERARIAREMHDVLAHRISLISMHAGALSYRNDLSADEIRSTAELIQTKSHEALADLRQVLGVLRGDQRSAVELRERPQPTFDDLVALISEAEQSGMCVQYDNRVQAAAELPDQVGRTTYRIVQEGLTNARKHAPGVTVLVAVSGSPADGLQIRIRNPARSTAAAPPPGAGLGLIGLVERAKLAGGRLDSVRDNGSFELRGWLPWSP